MYCAKNVGKMLYSFYLILKIKIEKKNSLYSQLCTFLCDIDKLKIIEYVFTVKGVIKYAKSRFVFNFTISQTKYVNMRYLSKILYRFLQLAPQKKKNMQMEEVPNKLKCINIIFVQNN